MHRSRPNRRAVTAAALAAACALGIAADRACGQRSLGLDISAWQGSISQTTWNNIRNVENREFVILRSSRGGTTGYYDQNNSDNSPPTNTFSQRYDDPYYIQNINRATTAGMYAGTYHFSRPDIIATTLNAGGIANTGTDEANHFMQMAGPWMRPGYLMPVHDLEAGDGIRTDDQMAQFCIDFSNRIYAVMGIRPAIYTNGNYAANILQTASLSLRNQVLTAYPQLWSARWPNQTNPDSILVHTAQPKDTYTPIYGPWDDTGVTHPWSFWQYASTGRLQSFNNGGSNLDMDVVQGGTEYLKDQLIPAVWMNDTSGQWTTLANWNSGQTPVMPVPGSGQVAPVGTLTLPTPRLPGAAGTGVTAGANDTVILDRPSANITVTHASGNTNIRRLKTFEQLDITGGTLSVSRQADVFSNVNVSGTGVFNPTWLTVGSGGLLKLAATGDKTLRAKTVDAAAGKIDLTNNKMVVDYETGADPIGTWNGTDYTGLLGLIKSGRNGGAWNGNGLITSMTAAQGAGGLTTLVAAEASDLLSISGVQTALWKGEPVDATSVLIAYTFGGDVNMDGLITSFDFARIDANAGHAGVYGYFNGDFNLDGQINAGDYAIINNSLAAMPEPASALLYVSALLLLPRRRLRGQPFVAQ